MPSAIILLATGAEEMEAVIPADVLTRAGFTVTIAGVTGSDIVCCSRNVNIKPDVALSEVKNNVYDIAIVPGGLGGSKILADSEEVGDILKLHESKDKYIACICAGPTVLKKFGIAKGKRVTSYPAVKGEFEGDYTYVEERVVIDGKLISSRAPGTAFEFSFAIVEAFLGKDKVDELKKSMLVE